MTNAETQGKRGARVGVWVLLLAWAVAGVINAGGFLMGNTPSASGVATTLVAVCVWPIAGWFAGSQPGAGLVRFATAFWIAVVAGAPLVLWALNTAPGLSAMQGGFVLPLLLFALAAPLYGLAAALPSLEPMVQTMVVGLAVFSMTLAAYLARRRVGRRSA